MGGYPALSIEMRKQAMNDGDSQRLFKHMVFNALIRNTDDHLRNHGFLVVDDKWTLSPLFDLAPSPAIAGVGRAFFASINIGVHGRIAGIDNLLSASHSFLLDKAEAMSIVQEMSATIIRHWQDVFAKNGVDADLFSGCFDNNLYEQLTNNKPDKSL
jgi:serine/threonine-protein kinase HipA